MRKYFSWGQSGIRVYQNLSSKSRVWDWKHFFFFILYMKYLNFYRFRFSAFFFVKLCFLGTTVKHFFLWTAVPYLFPGDIFNVWPLSNRTAYAEQLQLMDILCVNDNFEPCDWLSPVIGRHSSWGLSRLAWIWTNQFNKLGLAEPHSIFSLSFP